MSFTFNTSTNIGKVRSLIRDTVEATAILSDEDINVSLSITDNDILLAAAMSLRSIAINKALLEKSIKAGNYWEDNKGISKALLSLAEKYESMAENIPADAQAEVFATDFNYNEILYNKSLRGEND